MYSYRGNNFKTHTSLSPTRYIYRTSKETYKRFTQILVPSPDLLKQTSDQE